MVRRRWFWLLGLFAIPLAALGFDRVVRVCWVGYTDLEIEFIVTEADTRQPIRGAEITVLSEGGFYSEREEKQFKLETDHEGRARRVCHDSMCFGTQSGLCLTDTYVVHLPGWYIQVSAPGYRPSKWVSVNTRLTDIESQRPARVSYV